MSSIRIRGAGLDALAAAARFGKLGHHVELVHGDLPPAGPLAGVELPAGPEGVTARVDPAEPVIALPAAWRDLFTKSGRPLDPTLSAAGLELVAAPPVVHRFADGSQVNLPTDRAGQLHALTALVGRPAANAWTELVDGTAQVWQQLRIRGVERPRPEPLERADRDALRAGVSVQDLAATLPDARLRALLTSVTIRAGGGDPRRAPALLATRVAIDRTFGRWLLTRRTEDGRAPVLSTGELADAVLTRALDRGVHVVAEASAEAVDLELVAGAPEPPPGSRRRWFGRIANLTTPNSTAPNPTASNPAAPNLTALRPPRVEHRWADDAGAGETVDHTGDGPVVTWRRPVAPGASVVTVHDHAHPTAPDATRGWSVTDFGSWTARIDPSTGPARLPGAASSAGNEPWAQLLSAALAVYRWHGELTGTDVRPEAREQPQHRRGHTWLGDHITR